MPLVPLVNLTKGEISAELQARIDTSQYNAGTRRMRNFIVQRYGGAAFRPGFRFVGEVDDPTTEIRYIPFQYNIEQAYIMALDDGFMRLLANGGFVVEQDGSTEGGLQITAITKATTAQVTAAYHDYDIGDRVYFSGVLGMTEINGQFGTVLTTPTANTFTVDIDTTNYSTFVSSNGAVRVGAPTPPPAPPPPPPLPPEPPAVAPSTDAGGTGADLGGYEIDLGRWQYYN